MKNRFLQFFIAILVVLFFGCSTSSDGNGNSTTTVVPVTPSNLQGYAFSSTQINLSWTDNSTNETGFKIARKMGPNNFSVIATVNQNVNSFTVSGLSPNTTYTYVVYSFNNVGNSQAYSNEFNITTFSSTNINVIGPILSDIDGNVYQSVSNCGLTWTKSNLNVTKYTDGTTIPQITDSTQWENLTTGAWCYYNNSTTNGITYGKLYNWYAIMGIYDTASAANPALRKKLAPMGWHIPNDEEWRLLMNCLDPNAVLVDAWQNVAGGQMKLIGTSLWQSPNTGATNVSGFSGLPGGCYYRTFSSIGIYGFWWSSSVNVSNLPWCRTLHSNTEYLGRANYIKASGLSVRCVKD